MQFVEFKQCDLYIYYIHFEITDDDLSNLTGSRWCFYSRIAPYFTLHRVFLQQSIRFQGLFKETSYIRGK